MCTVQAIIVGINIFGNVRVACGRNIMNLESVLVGYMDFQSLDSTILQYKYKTTSIRTVN